MIDDFVKLGTHRGVNIYLEFVEIVGSSFEINDDGVEISTPIPKYDTYYTFFDSARYESFNEVTEAIESLYQDSITFGSNDEDFASIMNTKGESDE